MYKVVDIDYDDNGTETRKIMYSSAKEHDCWNFVISRNLHPSKRIRDDACRLFVFTPLDKLVTRIPKRVKDTVLCD